MALTVPTAAALLEHMQQTEFDPTLQEDWIADILQQATDLMFIATGLTGDPTDPQMLRIIDTGILAMAYALLIQSPDRPAIYSPFTSEHIGSYSYTRAMAQLTSQVGSGQPTGVGWFDMAVRFFNSKAGDTFFSEDVFGMPYPVYERRNDPNSRNVPFNPDVFGGFVEFQPDGSDSLDDDINEDF